MTEIPAPGPSSVNHPGQIDERRALQDPGEHGGPPLRLFVAIELPPSLAKALATATQSMRSLAKKDVRWVAPENLHLTLKFLGAVPPADVERLVAAASAAMAPVVPFHCSLREWNLFGNRRGPAVLYAAVADPAPIARLAGDLDRALEPLGYERERRPFRAHVTLARIRSTAAMALIRSAVARLGPAPSTPFLVDAAFLFSSQTGRAGPVYTPLAHLPLSGQLSGQR